MEVGLEVYNHHYVLGPPIFLGTVEDWDLGVLGQALSFLRVRIGWGCILGALG